MLQEIFLENFEMHTKVAEGEIRNYGDVAHSIGANAFGELEVSCTCNYILALCIFT